MVHSQSEFGGVFWLHKSEFYSDVKEHVLTEANKQKAKKGLKIAGIVFGIIMGQRQPLQ